MNKERYYLRSEAPVALGGGGAPPLRWTEFFYQLDHTVGFCDGARIETDGIGAREGTLAVTNLTHGDAGFTMDFELPSLPTEDYRTVVHSSESACRSTSYETASRAVEFLAEAMELSRDNGAEVLGEDRYRITRWQPGPRYSGVDVGLIAYKELSLTEFAQESNYRFELVGRAAP